MDKNEYLLKIVVLGHSTKLKEKLMCDFTSSSMKGSTYMPSGFEVVFKKICVGDANVKLILIVTKEDSVFDFGKMKRSWYRGSSAGAIFFDKGDIDTFNVVEERIREFRKIIPDPNIPLHIVGVKKYKDFITTEEAQVLADKYHIKYFDVNFFDSESIEEVFRSLTRLVLAAKDLTYSRQ